MTAITRDARNLRQQGAWLCTTAVTLRASLMYDLLRNETVYYILFIQNKPDSSRSQALNLYSQWLSSHFVIKSGSSKVIILCHIFKKKLYFRVCFDCRSKTSTKTEGESRCCSNRQRCLHIQAFKLFPVEIQNRSMKIKISLVIQV